MHNIVGKEVVRVDGYEKVTGKAVYGDDIKHCGMLHAANRYTDIPAGKIKKIDLSKAEKMEGVEKIALYNDIPGKKRIGPIRQDHYVIVNDEVFYTGDVIALVAAKTREQACAAADAIEIEYEPVEGIYDPAEAIKPTARLIHTDYVNNIVNHYPLVKGDVEKGFTESQQVIEREYRTGFHEHAYIEPETVTAIPDATTKGIKIFGSIQNPFTTRRMVAAFMGLNFNQVNVFGSTLGGSFGGKDDIINCMACRVALLSKMTGKAIKLTYTREESIKESYKRHPYILNYKVGFNNDGKLISMKINIIADSGAYASQSFFVTWRSVVQATGPYEIENVQTDIRSVYTNNPYTAAFRGFGSPQIIFAQESLMDEIAAMCDITPLEIRRLNGFKQGSITASGQVLSEHKVSLNEVIEKAIERSDYNNKREEFKKLNEQNSRYKLGIGFACSYRGCSLGAEGVDATSAIVSVQADGSVYVLAGLNENGQGLRTTFCQIASEVLGTKLEKVTFLEPQTATVPDGGPTVASRATLTGGNAVIDAAQKIKKTIFDIIKYDLNVSDINETVWANGFISLKNSNEKNTSISFENAVEKSFKAGVNLSAYGWFKAPDVSWHEETGQGNAYFTYVYGCQVAEIKVDTSTGKIEVIKITAAHDVGRAINKIGIEGQVYGGVAQGIGYTILEDFNIQNGIVKSSNLDEYLLPTIKDINIIEPILVENPDKYGPFGAKSIGEPTLELASAAINNAIKFATGKYFYQIPLTLERVYLGKNLVKPERQSEAGLSIKKRKNAPRVSNITMISPKTLKKALALKNEEYKIIAGGTDVIVELRKRNHPEKLLNISQLKELKKIKKSNDEIIIGSTVSVTNIISHKEIIKHFPLLVEACSLIGSKQIRNRATLGGNIVNAAPCADSVPPLILYNARVVLQSKDSSREIPVNDFVIKNYETQIKPDEILTAIVIPIPKKKYFHSYYQLGRRNAVNITRMSVGVMILFDNQKNIEECRIASGSLFDKPKRIEEIEKLFIGSKLTEQVIDEIENPLKNIIDSAIGKRWSSEYKTPVFINLCKDVLKEVLVKVEKS
ncbi:MAG TPA: molybdopterin-dependent oxidoreductase [Bacteroidales bacterium]|nr:molybdopterin-dependent oxidoreductase [Bacteroidales bacterium]HPS17437.1 molybdopterin-dependent oxidoreductase [Bacteroidales bacterium]